MLGHYIGLHNLETNVIYTGMITKSHKKVNESHNDMFNIKGWDFINVKGAMFLSGNVQ